MARLTFWLALLVATLLSLAGVSDTAEAPTTTASAGPTVYGLPTKIYWGCYYDLIVSDLAGTAITVFVVRNRDLEDVVGDLLFEGNPPGSRILLWFPEPAQIPAGEDYQVVIQDEQGSNFGPTFSVVAQATPPEDDPNCYGRVDTTFSIASSTSAPSSAKSSSTNSASATPTSKSSSSAAAASSATSGAASANAGNSHCHDVDPRVPTDWTCTDNENCITLADGSSAICCSPSENNCDWMPNAVCDIETYSNTDHMFFSSSSADSFPACGAQCCQFGYECIESGTAGNFCKMLTDQSSLGKSPDQLGGVPRVSDPATVGIATATGSAPSSAQSTSNSVAAGTDSGQSSVSTGTIAGITVASVAGIALIAAAATWFFRRRAKKDRKDSEDEIKPYTFSTSGVDGAAASPEAREDGVNKEVGHHFEKDGAPIESSFQSPMQSPMYNAGYSQANGQNMQASANNQPQAPIHAYQPKVFEMA